MKKTVILALLLLGLVVLERPSLAFDINVANDINPSTEGNGVLVHGNATDVLKDYFSSWMKGDYANMYKYLLKSDKKIISQETFVNEFKKAEAGGLKIESFKLSKAVFKTARGYAEVNVKITFTEKDQKFDIVKTVSVYVEDSEWRISTIPIYFPGSPSSMLPD